MWCRLYRGVRFVSDESPLKRLVQEASAFGEAEQQHTDLRWSTQPYSHSPNAADAEAQVDPRATTVLLFPGQGAQFVGMGKRLLDTPCAKDVYEVASRTLGWDVAEVCTRGPEKELTRRCQECLVATSLAAAAAWAEARPGSAARVARVAGFSLGEVTALAWTGALSPEDAFRFVALRAAATQAAARERKGATSIVWTSPDCDINNLLRDSISAGKASGIEAPVLEVANYLYAGCRVLAGDEACVKFVEREGSSFGVRRSRRLGVPAFHTPLMSAAVEPLQQGLKSLNVRAPRVTVVSAMDARPYRSAADVVSRLSAHVATPLRWEQTLHKLYARPKDHPQPLTVALGPAIDLRSTLRKVNARAWDSCIHVLV